MSSWHGLHVLEFDSPNRDEGLRQGSDISAQRCDISLNGRCRYGDLTTLVVDETLAPTEVDRQQSHRADLRLVEHIGPAGVIGRGLLALLLGLLLPLRLGLGHLRRRLRRLVGGWLSCLRAAVVLEVLVGPEIHGDQSERADLSLVEEVRPRRIAGDDPLRALHRLRDGGLSDACGEVEIGLDGVDHGILHGQRACTLSFGRKPAGAFGSILLEHHGRSVGVEVGYRPRRRACTAHRVLPALTPRPVLHLEHAIKNPGT